MKRIFVGTLLVLLSACSLLPTDSSVQPVALEQAFTLAEGRRAVVVQPRLVVEFMELLEDDRCREGTACFGIGTFVVRLRMALPDTPPETLEVRLYEGGTVYYRGYHIHADQLLPEAPPHEGLADDYRLRLRVSYAPLVD